jgi:hypothetical protein
LLSALLRIIFVFEKMKRIALLVIAVTYLVSVSGVAWGNFYCCGKLKETFLFSSKEASKISKTCKGNKLPGCCDTKTFFAKVKDNHSPSTEVKVKGASCSTLMYSAAVFNTIFQSANSIITFASTHAPPLLSKLPVYLSVCVFRI